MSELELKLYIDNVFGIEMVFLDSVNSFTVPEVFKELKNDFYGLETVEIKPSDIIVDVGANVGMFSIYAHKKFGCNIIAFEPVKKNYDNFVRNILLNGLDINKFEIHNVAVTDKQDSFVTIGIQEYNLGGSSMFYVNNTNNERCRTVTLNDYITPKCKYLKLDCEGAEYMILPSIQDKINTFNYVGIEFHHIEGKGYDGYKEHKNLKEKFEGKIFPDELVKMPTIASYLL